MTPQAKLDFALSWLNMHSKLAGQLRKPLVLSEFGKKSSHSCLTQEGNPDKLSLSYRSSYFKKVRLCDHFFRFRL